MLRWLLFLLILTERITGSHFDGGTIQWIPVNNNVSTSPVAIIITQTYTYTLSSVTCTVGSRLVSTTYGYNFTLSCIANCGATSAGYVAPPVLGYCTGTNALLGLAFVQRSDTVNLTANDYFSISHSIPASATQGYYRTLTLSSGGTDSAAHWNITALIDIRPRADNGLINTPPKASIMSPYGVPYNISTQITISTMDVDGDNVRCRWSNSTLECGNVCFPRTIPASTTLSSNCTLTITGTSLTAWYCAAIQVEDFLNSSTSLQPMSSTAVQFLVYVYKPKNCSVPVLSSPSTCVGVRVGVPYVLTLTAINYCGSSSNISSIVVQSFSGIVQGALVLKTANKTLYAMNITYTPLASQVGLQILCSTALDNTNIPSKQYCVTFIVGSGTTPTCPGVTTTTVTTTTSQTTTSSTTLYVNQTTTTSLQINQTTTTSLQINQIITSQLLPIDVDTTPAALTVNSLPVDITLSEELPTAQTTGFELTSENEIITTESTSTVSSTSTSKRTSTPRSASINWPLIGSLISLISLLAILCSCCVCYHYLWGPAARRRRRQQQKQNKRQPKYRDVNERVSTSTNISHPLKANRMYDIETDIAKHSAVSTGTRQLPRISKNIIRTDRTGAAIPDTQHSQANARPSDNILVRVPSLIDENETAVNIPDNEHDDHSRTNRLSNTGSHQVKKAVKIVRVSSRTRCKSMTKRKQLRRSRISTVLVTRVKK